MKLAKGWIIAICAVIVVLGGWGVYYAVAGRAAPQSMTLATTTSVQDSGLLDVLLPPFEKEHNCTVKVVAVGSGQALELGKSGDADALFVHSPAAEKTFMDEGHGESRDQVMHNYFILVGPAGDPLGLAGKDLASAMTAIAEAGKNGQAIFFSRGDKSGTDTKEKSLWKTFGLENAGDWYKEVGSGMGDTLRMTAEQQGYTLSDKATFLSLYGPGTAGDGKLVIVVEDAKELLNTYSIIVVDPVSHPNINLEMAHAFRDYVLSEEAYQIIDTYGVDKFGQKLFWPDFTPEEGK